VGPTAEWSQSRALEQQLERVESEIANVSGRARARVELDVVWRAAEHQLGAAAERHQVGRGDRQPSVRLKHPCQLVEHGLRVEDVLDHFGSDNGAEAFTFERQRGFELRAYRA